MAIIRGRKRRGWWVGGRFILCPQFTGTTEGGGGGGRGLPPPVPTQVFIAGFFSGSGNKSVSPRKKKTKMGFPLWSLISSFSPQTEIHFSGSSDPYLGRSNIGRSKRYRRGIKRERENISSPDCTEKKDRNFLSQASWFRSSFILNILFYIHFLKLQKCPKMGAGRQDFSFPFSRIWMQRRVGGSLWEN